MAWQLKTYEQLTKDELYKILQLRINVFVVEQETFYEDLDDHDQNALHLTYIKDGKILAYTRILPPGEKFEEASLGRVITCKETRGTGLGKDMLTRVMAEIKERWPQAAVFIQAQAYLENFYGAFGFKAISEPYMYECLPHMDMKYVPEV